MLTVYSVLWGDKYPIEYVQRLQSAVRQYLSVSHQFRCVTDQLIPGVQTVFPLVDWPGWWQKLSLFAIADGPSLYFDLDNVILNKLDYLADFTRFDFASPANWGQSGHGGVQSSVMAWNGKWREPFSKFNPETDPARLWGDQEFISELRGNQFISIPGIYSYKYHCLGGKPPEDAAVVTFHGKPDYHECNDKWILQYIATHR